MSRPGKAPVQVILFSTSIGEWEVWEKGRPLARGSVPTLRQHYPNAIGPSAAQEDIEIEYLKERA